MKKVLTSCLALSCLLAARSWTGSKEIRALWVVRTTLQSPDSIQEMVERAAHNGFNTLIVQVRGRGDAFYRSRWEPRSDLLKDQPAEFDPLAHVLKLARSRGLQVHAWLNTHLLANFFELPQQEAHVANAHPEWLAVPRQLARELYRMDPKDPRYKERLVQVSRGDLSELEGLYTAPAHPAVQEHLYSIWMDVLEQYEIDGLHFDYVRYPNPNFDYSRASLDRFRSQVERRLEEGERTLLARVAAEDPLVYTTTFPQAWDQFRRDQITHLVERIYNGVKSRRPSAQVTAAVFANDADAYNRRFQDWKLWLEMGILDAACPMAYTPESESFKNQIAVARGYSFQNEIWAGIGAWRIPLESTLEKISIARRLGADGIVLFSYDNLVRPSEHSPEGRYLEELSKSAFEK